MILVAPGVGHAGADRAYVLYNMNLQNVSTDGPGGAQISRVDMLGGFFLRYSDDAGATWSRERFPVPYAGTERWQRKNARLTRSVKVPSS